MYYRWNKEYGQEGFHFGARYYDDKRNCGYFLKDGVISSYSIDGKILGAWTSFSDILTDELQITEKIGRDLIKPMSEQGLPMLW